MGVAGRTVKRVMVRSMSGRVGDSDHLFQRLVQLVDGSTDAAEQADEGRELVHGLQSTAYANLSEGTYGLYGLIQEAEQSLGALQGATRANLGYVYDDLNRGTLYYKTR